jgi:hypothetical protein
MLQRYVGTASTLNHSWSRVTAASGGSGGWLVWKRPDEGGRAIDGACGTRRSSSSRTSAVFAAASTGRFFSMPLSAKSHRAR